MSAHVVVIDQTARRHTIKLSPETILNEVFLQACKKAGVDSTTHGLKHSGRSVDLSLPFRYTKLVPGAKLELVQLPKGRATTSEVTVALQMMDGGGNRLTAKFPSTTSIWSILRTFESKSRSLGVAGINITEQATASTDNGSGRLYYAMPVVQVVNRELASLDDLKLTLQAMGFNSGTALLRLKMRATEIPLEDALVKIAELEPATEAPTSTPATANPEANVPLPPTPAPEVKKEEESEDLMNMEEDPSRNVLPPAPSAPESAAKSQSEPESAQTPAAPSPIPTTLIEGRQVTVFAPAQNAVPEAAKLEIDESEYELNISQAKLFQNHLAASGRPKRLLSEAELAEKEKLAQERKSKIETVEVRVRFPDQLMIQTTFKGTDKAEDLYAFVRSTLRHPNEPFYIYMTPPVRKILPTQGRLVQDCQFTNRTLVNFSWEQSTASKKAQSETALQDTYVKIAKQIQVQLEVKAAEEEKEEEAGKGKGKGKGSGSGGGSGSGSGSGSGGGLGGKVPKWLKIGK